MGYGAYSFVAVMAMAVMASAVYGLYWAVKTGQFRHFEKGATAIFSEEEPEGVATDYFPTKKGGGVQGGKRPRAATAANRQAPPAA